MQEIDATVASNLPRASESLGQNHHLATRLIQRRSLHLLFDGLFWTSITYSSFLLRKYATIQKRACHMCYRLSLFNSKKVKCRQFDSIPKLSWLHRTPNRLSSVLLAPFKQHSKTETQPVGPSARSQMLLKHMQVFSCVQSHGSFFGHSFKQYL